MEFIPTAALAALVIAVINFLKYLRAKDWNGVFTQASAWIAGVVVILLVAQTDFASGIAIGDKVLSDINGAGIVFVGLTVASAGSFLVELKKAFDGSDSAAKPDLLNPPKVG